MRRVSVLVSHLEPERAGPGGESLVRLEVVAHEDGADLVVQIGEASTRVKRPSDPLLVPCGYYDHDKGASQEALRVLQFIMKKESLRQDVFLIGPPGPLRRRLALAYCELTSRDVEYLGISQDLTEGDIKQRREIKDKTAFYLDAPAVRAALTGRILVLDGIEKAERNVLPVINNLLENREMTLEDGRSIVHPARYATLMRTHGRAQLDEWRMVPAHRDFVVIALGLPVPPFFGNPLDPPLRSRFQGRSVTVPPASVLLADMRKRAPDAHPKAAQLLLRLAEVLHDIRHDTARGIDVPEFPMGNLVRAAGLLSLLAGPHHRKAPPSDTDMDTTLRAGAGAATASSPQAVPDSQDAGTAAVVTPRAAAAAAAYAASFLYPFGDMGPREVNHEIRLAVHDAYDNLGLPRADRPPPGAAGLPPFPVVAVVEGGRSTGAPRAVVTVGWGSGSTRVADSFVVPSGPALHAGQRVKPSVGLTALQRVVVTRLLHAHSRGDVCLFGPKGVGKSAVVREFARLTGYAGARDGVGLGDATTLVAMFRDMTTRDLFERRVTAANGDTSWAASALVDAAERGYLVILDGVDQIHPGTLAAVQRLVHDREMTLPSGRRFMAVDRFRQLAAARGLGLAELRAAGVTPIHPSFRVVAVARPPRGGAQGGASVHGQSWLTAEVNAMFFFVWMRPLSADEQAEIIRTVAPGAAEHVVRSLSLLVQRLQAAQDRDDDGTAGLGDLLSLRQLLRLARRMAAYPGTSLHAAIHDACLSRFMIRPARLALDQVLGAVGIVPAHVATTVRSEEQVDEAGSAGHGTSVSSGADADRKECSIEVRDGVLRINHVRQRIPPARAPLLVPRVLFYENRRQTLTLEAMLKDWQNGEHLMLIGNQGVGKNKLCDKFLQLMGLPREYIQLHRDSTVNQLTTRPSIQDGVLVFEDSPLVRAAREGYVLVIDEADKAPTHVTAVLKGLAEDRDMLLSDGRRIKADHAADATAGPGTPPALPHLVPLHRDFRMMVLANRPGYPFLGNDFFRVVGSVFSAFCVDNPDPDSEMELLERYTKRVPHRTLKKLIAAFNELRGLVDDGQLSYPYSTRELVNVVRHLDRFPSDGVGGTLRSILDFDAFSVEERDLLTDVFRRQGIVVDSTAAVNVDLGVVLQLPVPVVTETWRVDGGGESVTLQVATLSMPLRTRPDTGGVAWDVTVGVPQAMPQADARAETFQETTRLFTAPGVVAARGGVVVDVAALPRSGLVVVASHAYDLRLWLLDLNEGTSTEVDPFAAVTAAGRHRTGPSPDVRILPTGPHTFVTHDRRAADSPGVGAAGALCGVDVGRKVAVHAILDTVLPEAASPSGGGGGGGSIVRRPRRDGSGATVVVVHGSRLALFRRGDQRGRIAVLLTESLFGGRAEGESAAPCQAIDLGFGILRVHGVGPLVWLVEGPSPGVFHSVRLERGRPLCRVAPVRRDPVRGPDALGPAAGYQAQAAHTSVPTAVADEPTLSPPSPPARPARTAHSRIGALAAADIKLHETPHGFGSATMAATGGRAYRLLSSRGSYCELAAGLPGALAWMRNVDVPVHTFHRPTHRTDMRQDGPAADGPAAAPHGGRISSTRPRMQQHVFLAKSNQLAHLTCPAIEDAERNPVPVECTLEVVDVAGGVVRRITVPVGAQPPAYGELQPVGGGLEPGERALSTDVGGWQHTRVMASAGGATPRPAEVKVASDMPLAGEQRSNRARVQRAVAEPRPAAHACELPDGTVVLVDLRGNGRIVDVVTSRVRDSLNEWVRMQGARGADAQILDVRFSPASTVPEDVDGEFEWAEGESEGKGEGESKGEGGGSGQGKGTGKGDGDGDGGGSGDGKGQGSGGGSGDGDGQGTGSGGGSGGGGSREASGGRGMDVEHVHDQIPEWMEFDGDTALDAPEGVADGAADVDGGKATERDSDEDEAAKKAAAEAKEAAWKRMLERLNMTEGDMERYLRYRQAVSREIRELRSVLDALEARKNERAWLRNKDNGDLDDSRLIDGLTGDRNVYKMRGERPPEQGSIPVVPKQIQFLFDLSMSMSRYSMDGRLQRSLESAVMIMEAFQGYESKVRYEIWGHSGDSPNVELVTTEAAPSNDRERLQVVRKMAAHAEMCDSGDNTLASCELAVKNVVKQDADEHFIFLVSDANLEQYGIDAAHLQRLLRLDPRVRVFIIFIGSLGDQASRLSAALPAGQVFTALDTKQIPRIMKSCLLMSM